MPALRPTRLRLSGGPPGGASSPGAGAATSGASAAASASGASGGAPGSAAGVARGAVRGLFWVMPLGVLARAIQALGTLAITAYLDRAQIGEVTNAAILVGSVSAVSQLSIPSYLATRRTLSKEVIWHAAMILALVAVPMLGGLVGLAGPIGALVGTPAAARYVAPLAAAALLQRVAALPEVLLNREERFAAVAVARSASELTYTVGSLGLAALGAGPMAIVGGNLMRASLHAVWLLARSPVRAWFVPVRYRRVHARGIWRFGLPLLLGHAAAMMSRTWDNLAVSSVFGAAVVGAYNLAYNLADIPAAQVTELVGDVLAPSLAKLEGRARIEALARILGVLALVVHPLAVGLSVVSRSLVTAAFRAEWQPVAPLLAVLALMALWRPLGWTVSVYLQTMDRPRLVTGLMLLLVASLLPAIVVLGELRGPEAACAGVCLGFMVHAVASLVAAARVGAIPLTRLVAGPLRALAACAPLVAAVLGAREGLRAAGGVPAWVGLVVEVVAGAVGYGLGVLLFARRLASDLIDAVRSSRAGRNAGR